MSELEKAYMTLQSACAIKVGDTVKILRKAESKSLGWSGVWSSSMSECVGKNGVVDEVGKYGISVSTDDNDWNYPFFVLEKIPKPHWRDTVSPENPVLCYVRDEDHEEWSEHCFLVVGYDNYDGKKYPYIANGTIFKYAKRVPKSMIESMLKAYDETSEDE